MSSKQTRFCFDHLAKESRYIIKAHGIVIAHSIAGFKRPFPPVTQIE